MGPHLLPEPDVVLQKATEKFTGLVLHRDNKRFLYTNEGFRVAYFKDDKPNYTDGIRVKKMTLAEAKRHIREFEKALKYEPENEDLKRLVEEAKERFATDYPENKPQV